MKNKFGFFEIVRVINGNRHSGIAGREAVVRGMSENEETGKWAYAVSVTGTDTCWCIEEADLLATGRFADKSEICPDPPVHIKVVVDKRGRGQIVGQPTVPSPASSPVRRVGRRRR